MNYSALIMAGGKTSDLTQGNEKMFKMLKRFGQTVLERSIQLFLHDPHCQQIVVVTNPHDINRVVSTNTTDKIVHVNGGHTRFESVLLGLMAVKEDVVLIHNGERPWVHQANLDALLTTMENYPAAILAIKNHLSIHVADEQGFLSNQKLPEPLYLLQTPQAYRTSQILEAYMAAEKDGFISDEDATIYNRLFEKQAKLVMGSICNNIVLDPKDYDL